MLNKLALLSLVWNFKEISLKLCLAYLITTKYCEKVELFAKLFHTFANGVTKSHELHNGVELCEIMLDRNAPLYPKQATNDPPLDVDWPN